VFELSSESCCCVKVTTFSVPFITSSSGSWGHVTRRTNFRCALLPRRTYIRRKGLTPYSCSHSGTEIAEAKRINHLILPTLDMNSRQIGSLSSILASSAQSTGFTSGTFSDLSARFLSTCVSLQSLAQVTETNVGNYIADDGIQGLRISRRLVYFSMAIEDNAAGRRTAVCNGCYNTIIRDQGYPSGTVVFSAFNHTYRSIKSTSDLAEILVQHHLIEDIGGIPTCPHGPLLNAILNNAPEIVPQGQTGAETYCLWSIDAPAISTSSVRTTDRIADLRLIGIDRNLEGLKIQALRLDLTQDQRAYVIEYTGQNAEQQTSRFVDDPRYW
jgi:hypothetical protein